MCFLDLLADLGYRPRCNPHWTPSPWRNSQLCDSPENINQNYGNVFVKYYNILAHLAIALAHDVEEKGIRVVVQRLWNS